MTVIHCTMTWFTARISDERGANLVEYAILVGFIALVAIGAVAALGGGTSAQYSEITSKLG